MTETQFEALTRYDLDAIYRVDGVGVYHGATLIEYETWAPAAGDLYVATDGDDGEDGTDPEAPKLTIESAFNSISTSNTATITIWVAAGTPCHTISPAYHWTFALASHNLNRSLVGDHNSDGISRRRNTPVNYC